MAAKVGTRIGTQGNGRPVPASLSAVGVAVLVGLVAVAASIAVTLYWIIGDAEVARALPASVTVPAGGAPPAGVNLGVNEQVSDGASMRVGEVDVAGSPAWVVVQRDAAGVPGAVVGLARRLDGDRSAVTVQFRQPVQSGHFWVTLRRDLGVPGRFESPGADVVATATGMVLSRPITLTVR